MGGTCGSVPDPDCNFRNQPTTAMAWPRLYCGRLCRDHCDDAAVGSTSAGARVFAWPVAETYTAGASMGWNKRSYIGRSARCSIVVDQPARCRGRVVVSISNAILAVGRDRDVGGVRHGFDCCHAAAIQDWPGPLENAAPIARGRDHLGQHRTCTFNRRYNGNGLESHTVLSGGRSGNQSAAGYQALEEVGSILMFRFVWVKSL